MTLASTNPPIEVLTRLIDHHGARATLATLLRVLVDRHRARRKLRRDAAALTNHLRQDVGLPPQATTRRHWELR